MCELMDGLCGVILWFIVSVSGTFCFAKRRGKTVSVTVSLIHPWHPSYSWCARGHSYSRGARGDFMTPRLGETFAKGYWVWWTAYGIQRDCRRSWQDCRSPLFSSLHPVKWSHVCHDYVPIQICMQAKGAIPTIFKRSTSIPERRSTFPWWLHKSVICFISVGVPFLLYVIRSNSWWRRVFLWYGRVKHFPGPFINGLTVLFHKLSIHSWWKGFVDASYRLARFEGLCVLASLCFSPFELFLQHFPICRLLLYIHGKFVSATIQQLCGPPPALP